MNWPSTSMQYALIVCLLQKWVTHATGHAADSSGSSSKSRRNNDDDIQIVAEKRGSSDLSNVDSINKVAAHTA